MHVINQRSLERAAVLLIRGPGGSPNQSLEVVSFSIAPSSSKRPPEACIYFNPSLLQYTCFVATLLAKTVFGGVVASGATKQSL